MPETFAPGEWVVSSEFGPGIVKTISGNGAFVAVHFDAIGGVERVHASDLRRNGVAGALLSAANGAVATVVGVAQSRAVTTPPPGCDERRLGVECLRQGLPPPGRLASWTVGARTARAQVDAAIRRAAGGAGTTLLARAGYGKGKSHVGRLARELAAEARFATLHIELNGEAVTLRTGARWLSLLFSSLLLPQVRADEEARVAGLGELLRRAATKGMAAGADLAVFNRFLDSAAVWVDSEEAILVLEGYLSGDINAAESSRRFGDLIRTPIRLPSLGVSSGIMEDRRKAQCEQLARIIRLAGHCGAAGSLVVIDELDHDLKWEDGRCAALLRSLIRVVTGERMVVLLLAKDDSELEIDGAEELVIDPLEDGDMAAIVDKTCDTFAAAFPLPALSSGRAELVRALKKRYQKEYDPRGWGPRFFVRAAIEACEVVRARSLSSLADVKV
jgi:bacteriophage exclusion system BrxC/D-like protein